MSGTSSEAQALSDAVSRVRETEGNAALTSQLRSHLAAAQSEGLSSQYPRALYHENGDTKVVLSSHEEDEAADDGFGRDPHPIHRGISAPPIEDMPEQIERAGPRRGRPPKAAMQPDASAVAEHPDTASAPDLTNVKE